MTLQEFRMKYLNLRFTGSSMEETNEEITILNDIPDSLDWRTKGAVTEVKDQGQCGSCWAFSVVNQMESKRFIKTGELLEFSEQQLVDCDTKKDQGCNGGLMEYGFQYLEKNPLELSKDYPYQAEDGECSADKKKGIVEVEKFVLKKKANEKYILSLLQEGPVSIAVNADKFFDYESGVMRYDAEECDPNALNHGVAIVGYGYEKNSNGDDGLYYIVRNSWGSAWGEEGYLRMSHSTCGNNSYVITAQIK
jgi:C1A family cysteine protease